LQINLSGNQDNDTESHHSNATRKVGKATFLSPTAAGANRTFMTTISSPDNASRVTQQLMQMQSRIYKEANRVEKLKQVKMNSVHQAELDLKKIH